ncbi:hypothetical protein Hdeb2414_s0009g00304351 [Helianthus debilis subsp. tardiflorus]
MAEEHHQEENPGEEGPLRVLKWDLGLFEQITRGFQFPQEWDARYPGQNQTAADAPPGYITFFEDFFLQAKKILLNPPKIFHDWKQKFFFIREEVLPIAMTFCPWTDPIEKKELAVPKKEDWYVKHTATPNRVFGENVQVAVHMSDQWPLESKEVPVLKFQDREVRLYQVAFPTFGGSMGLR